MTEEKTAKSRITIGRVIFAVISFVGISGFIAILKYVDERHDKFEKKYQEEIQIYESQLAEWTNFSPPSLTGLPQTVVLNHSHYIDLESGSVLYELEGPRYTPEEYDFHSRQWDLSFGYQQSGFYDAPYRGEYLKACDGVSWFEVGIHDFDTIKYRDIRDANYSIKQHPVSKRNHLYFSSIAAHSDGFVYYIKTCEGNIAKLQIKSYEQNIPFRNMNILYEVFPIVEDPPKPIPPIQRSKRCEYYNS